jgi:hypothetical protein
MTKKKRKRWENQIRSVKKSLRASENRFFGVSENAWVHHKDRFRGCWINPYFYDEDGRKYKMNFCGMGGWYRDYE